MQSAIKLSVLQQPEYVYQVLRNGEPEGDTVPQWTLIEAIDTHRYHCLEVYNVFEYENGKWIMQS